MFRNFSNAEVGMKKLDNHSRSINGDSPFCHPLYSVEIEGARLGQFKYRCLIRLLSLGHQVYGLNLHD
jgi:hypothetical protein